MCHNGYITGYIKIHQDTCILDSSSQYIKIHQDTKSRYMYLGCVMMTLQDTFKRYMRDTSEIHYEIHVPQMYLERYVSEMQDTCGIHAGYMRDTCICKGVARVIKIHAGYI